MHVLAMEVGCKFCYVLWFSVLVTMTGGVRGVVYDYSEIEQKQGNISTGKRILNQKKKRNQIYLKLQNPNMVLR